MYSEEIEELIEAIIADGVYTEKEKSVIHKRAMDADLDPDEIDVIIEGRLAARKNEMKSPLPDSMQTGKTYAKDKSDINPQWDKKGSLKYGSLRKCPNCGAIVKPGVASCSTCNFEFVDTQAVASVKQLSDKIMEVEKRYPISYEDEKEEVSKRASAEVSIITTFPVPNTREDLLDFIVFTESKFLHLDNSTASDVAIIKAYKSKYIECVERAKIYFNNDPQFQFVFQNYSANKKKKWRELGPNTRLGILSIIGILGFFIFLLILIFIADANGW